MAYAIEIDLHGHTVESAGKLLNDTLKKLPKDVREVHVIHGYRQGTALRDLVRRFRHPRVERKILGMNQGSTIFLIKNKYE